MYNTSLFTLKIKLIENYTVKFSKYKTYVNINASEIEIFLILVPSKLYIRHQCLLQIQLG